MSEQGDVSKIQRSLHLDGRLGIYSAYGNLTRDLHVTDPIEDGLKLVISNTKMDIRAAQNDLGVTHRRARAHGAVHPV